MGLRVEFHTGLADPLQAACRMVGKAHKRGTRVLITGSAERINEFDRLLWVTEPGSFLPHLNFARQPLEQAWAHPRAARTPVWLCSLPEAAAQAGAPDAGPADSPAGEPSAWPGTVPDTCINLGPEMLPAAWLAADAPGTRRLQRVIELVGRDVEDTDAGRKRWGAYKAAGHLPSHETNAGQPVAATAA
jgi:DNA polymerase III subunit chi